jgi:hypothetical protein
MGAALQPCGPRAILVGMVTAQVLDLEPEPIVIYRSVNRDGQTFGLEPLSRNRVRERFGEQVHLHPRVFIAHESEADYESVRGELATLVVQLLTGVHPERLDELGGVSFRDPATDEEVLLERHGSLG